jgi:hypothetical protein
MTKKQILKTGKLRNPERHHAQGMMTSPVEEAHTSILDAGKGETTKNNITLRTGYEKRRRKKKQSRELESVKTTVSKVRDAVRTTEKNPTSHTPPPSESETNTMYRAT